MNGKMRHRTVYHFWFITRAMLIGFGFWTTAAVPQDSWLPSPSGPYALGVKTLYLADSSRAEVVTRDTADVRRIITHVYYPANAIDTAKEFRRYFDGYPPKTYKLAKRHLGLPQGYFLDSTVDVATHARVNASPADSGAPFPLIILSHGYLSSPVVHTHIAEELASYGYVVVLINHSYESTGAVFPNGELAEPQLKFLRKAIFQGWELPFMLTAKPGKRKLRYTRRVLRRSRAMNERVDVWVGDIEHVIDVLGSGRSGVPGGLGQCIDFTHIGTMGHSFGGSAAGYACFKDSRIKCAVNMDGFQYGRGITDSSHYNGPLLLVESDQMGNVNDMFYAAKEDFFKLRIAHSRHVGLTDVSLWPNLPRRTFKKRIGIEGIAKKLDTVIVAFFDFSLRGAPMNALVQLKTFREIQQ